MAPGTTGKELKDWARKPVNSFLWWGLPILLGIASGFTRFPAYITAFIWTGLFVWMGAGCVINAMRCRRVHCYISGPVLLIGATVCALIGFGFTGLGLHALYNTIGMTLMAVLLSFVPEMVWRRYA